MRIRGIIVLPADAPPFFGASVRVRLEDTSMADIPAKTLVELVISGVDCEPAVNASIPFVLEGNVQMVRGRYSIRVLIDIDGDGDISKGDFISTTSNPVDASLDEMTIHVSRVN